MRGKAKQRGGTRKKAKTRAKKPAEHVSMGAPKMLPFLARVASGVFLHPRGLMPAAAPGRDLNEQELSRAGAFGQEVLGSHSAAQGLKYKGARLFHEGAKRVDTKSPAQFCMIQKSARRAISFCMAQATRLISSAFNHLNALRSKAKYKYTKSREYGVSGLRKAV